ncbi:CHAD domain-containing protein [Kineococcus gypseus]|uniref:CYTH and CHAD domain-containing protein n=1 Tax=Kineococcus gypseus TaxID=1637102 RepID=UPI003D7C49E5
MPSVHQEVEVTLVADDSFEVPALRELLAETALTELDAPAPVSEAAAVHQELTATYYDTADLRLAGAGLTLRRRTGGEDAGWHLKVPTAKGARSEVRLPLGRATRTVPQALRTTVRARTGGADLVPVATTRTRRDVHRLLDASGQVLAELADDRVEAQRLLRTGGAAQGTGTPVAAWREIEVELVDGEHAVLDALVDGLRRHGLRRAEGPSKLAHVLELDAGGTGADDAEGSSGRDAAPAGRGGTQRQGRLTRKSPAGDVVLTHLREQVEQVRAQDLPVRLDAPDAVHKMRVATRRLRSALTTFKPLLDPEVARPLRAELKWLAAQLGAARDAEVMRERVRAAVQAQADQLPHGVGADMDTALEATYRSAHQQLLQELDGPRYLALLSGLEALVERPPLTPGAARPAGKVLPRLVRRSWTAVGELVDRARASTVEAEREELLHDARKAAKAARYAGESVQVVFGADAADFARAMEAVQEALGEHQDSVLVRQRLQELALNSSSTAAAFAYGRLHALEEAGTARSQHAFDAAWRAAGRKHLHRWTR